MDNVNKSEGNSAIRILLYQAAYYRDVLSFLFNGNGGLHVAGIVNVHAEMERKLHMTQPNVVLLDIALVKDVDLCAQIKKYDPSVKILVLTDVAEISIVLKCLRSGADGYILLKKTTLPRLMDYIKDAYEGGTPISPSLMPDILKALAWNVEPSPDQRTLTKRESEILQLLVNGLTYKNISFTLNIALDTVRSHIKSIYEKLSVNSKSEAVAKALKYRMALA